jgi:hypothetical protein
MRRKIFRPEPGVRPGPLPGTALCLGLLVLAACRREQALVRREVRFEDPSLLAGAETRFSVALSSPSVTSFYRCEITLSDYQGRPLATQRPIDTKKPLRERGRD